MLFIQTKIDYLFSFFFYIIFFHFIPKFPLLCTIFFKLSNEFSKIRVTDQCNLKYFKTLLNGCGKSA